MAIFNYASYQRDSDGARIAMVLEFPLHSLDTEIPYAVITKAEYDQLVQDRGQWRDAFNVLEADYNEQKARIAELEQALKNEISFRDARVRECEELRQAKAEYEKSRERFRAKEEL